MSDPLYSIEAICKAAEPLFASAVAQGMHAPFALNVEYWGCEYAERLGDALEAAGEDS